MGRVGRERRIGSWSVAAALVAATILGGCGGDEGEGDAAARTTKAGNEAPAGDDLLILVTNDDGYAAAGIGLLVAALEDIEGVAVEVVAPLENASGAGGKTTPGDLEVTDVETEGGHPARAVAGFPADTLRVALDDLDLAPDLVVSGINEGQNLGPVFNASGTVGAARAAAERGIPALAVSQGLGAEPDYEAAVPFVVDWVEERRDRAGDGPGDAPAAVEGINVPTCASGEVRGLREVARVAASSPDILTAQDCTSTGNDPDTDDTVDDVEAFNSGFAVLSPIPVEAG